MPGIIDSLNKSDQRLLIEFNDAEGKPVLFDFPHVMSSNAINMKNLVKAILDNGIIFAHVPVTYVANALVLDIYSSYDLEA